MRLIFVDDGSSDGTVPLLQKLVAAAAGGAELLQLPQNCGEAEAVRRGMLHALESDAQYGAVGFWDSDLATPLSAVAELHSVLCSNPALQMVQGVRARSARQSAVNSIPSNGGVKRRARRPPRSEDPPLPKEALRRPRLCDARLAGAGPGLRSAHP